MSHCADIVFTMLKTIASAGSASENGTCVWL